MATPMGTRMSMENTRMVVSPGMETDLQWLKLLGETTMETLRPMVKWRMKAVFHRSLWRRAPANVYLMLLWSTWNRLLSVISHVVCYCCLYLWASMTFPFYFYHNWHHAFYTSLQILKTQSSKGLSILHTWNNNPSSDFKEISNYMNHKKCFTVLSVKVELQLMLSLTSLYVIINLFLVVYFCRWGAYWNLSKSVQPREAH